MPFFFFFYRPLLEKMRSTQHDLARKSRFLQISNTTGYSIPLVQRKKCEKGPNGVERHFIHQHHHQGHQQTGMTIIHDISTCSIMGAQKNELNISWPFYLFSPSTTLREPFIRPAVAMMTALHILVDRYLFFFSSLLSFPLSTQTARDRSWTLVPRGFDSQQMQFLIFFSLFSMSMQKREKRKRR